MVQGSCLCGGVRFEVKPPFIRANHCHCDRCRKHSGTAVCTQVRVWKEQFHLLSGEELIRIYGKGEGAVKAFCIRCGSSLFGGEWPDGPQVSIRMGAFDEDPGDLPAVSHLRRFARAVGHDYGQSSPTRRGLEPVKSG
jgi:hypothetical protein